MQVTYYINDKIGMVDNGSESLWSICGKIIGAFSKERLAKIGLQYVYVSLSGTYLG